MTNGKRKKHGHGKLFSQKDYYGQIRFDEYDADDISESKYPTFVLRIVRLFGFLTFALFLAAQRFYPCGGRISRGERVKRIKVLALFSAITSLLLTTAGYFELSLIWSHPPYKGVSQALLLSLLFLFYLGIFGMSELLGFQFAYDKEGFLKRSPVNIILDCRKAMKNHLRQSRTRKHLTRSAGFY